MSLWGGRLARTAMNIAVTGAGGLLGQALCKAFAKHHVSALLLQDLDITSLSAARRLFSDLKPDWIVHAAAFTTVDAAESNFFEAYRVNALGTRNIAVAAFESGSRLLYYSTDYVFDGRLKRPYREWDPTAPVNQYGYSKLAGEHFVRSLCPAHLIVRTSWLFGPGGSHFVGNILARAQKDGRLQVVNDQRGSPTFTIDLAYMTLCLLEGDKRGIYHATNSGDCSWFEFAREIVSRAGIEVEVSPIVSSDFPNAAPRPAQSVLENLSLKVDRIPLLRPWQNALAAFLND